MGTPRASGRRLSAWIGNRSIRTKIILTTWLIVFCAVILVVMCFYHVTAGIIIDSSRRYILSVMGQTGKNLDLKIKSVEDVLYNISVDQSLQRLLAEASGAADEYQATKSSIDIRKALNFKISKINEIKTGYLRANDGTVYYSGSYGPSEPDWDLWGARIAEGRGRSVWLGVDEERRTASVGKQMYDFESQKSLGALILRVDISYFENIIKGTSPTGDDAVFIICGSEDEQIGERPEGASLASCQALRPPLVSDATSLEEVSFQGRTRQLSRTPLSPEGWVLASLSPSPKDNVRLDRLRKATALLFASVLAAGTALSVAMGRSISRPIRNLARSMKQLSAGDFSVHVSVKYNDEIGMLRNSFNRMVGDIEGMMKKIAEEQDMKQKAQLWALRMQINPHFLYNTLDTINWLASQHHMNDICVVSQSLGWLLRYSLDNQDLVSFEQEFDAVERYIEIQKVRHGGRLALETDIEEAALYESIPPHTVLSMVENAVEHGFAQDIEKIRIRISARVADGTLRMVVEDDGKGIPPETLRRIQSESLSETGGEGSRSIGIRNVHRRIRIRYGEPYGVAIQSAEGKGTKVEITVPILPEADLDLDGEEEI